MYKFNDIGFRPLEEKDIDTVRLMHNEMSTLLNLGDCSLVSLEQQREWFKKMSHNRTNIVFGIFKEDAECLIGVWRLQNLDVINRNCEVGADIFPEYRGKGLGKKTYKMLFDYLFLHYNIHSIYLRVGEFNESARILYKKVGFVESGRLSETIFRHGKFWDNIIMCLTIDQFRNMEK